MYIKIKIKYILLTALSIYVFIIFFRDALQFMEYMLSHNKIPYFRISLEKTSIISYIRDISILVWNTTWSFFLLNKIKSVYFILLLCTLLVTIGLMLIGSDFQIFLLLADLRILNGVYSVVGVLLITQYFLKINNEFELVRIVKFFVFLSFVDAVISIIEFYIMNMQFGFRVMGIFSNAALNSYVLFMSLVLIYLLTYYKNIYKRTFYFLSLVLSFAILTTGTRTSIVGALILFVIFILIKLYHVKPRHLRTLIMGIAFFLFILVVPIVISIANLVADRGNMLNQGEAGRISKMIDIIHALSSDGLVYILFGKGSGIGSNIASSTLSLPKYYTSVDGTIQFLFVHSGLFGFLLLFFILFQSYLYIQNAKMFLIVILPMTIVSMSTNIFEIYPLLLMFGLSLALVKQQEYYKKKAFNI